MGKDGGWRMSLRPEPSPRNETLGRSSCSHRRWTRRANQISWESCGEIATGKPVRAAPLCGRKVPFNLAGAIEDKSGAVDYRR